MYIPWIYQHKEFSEFPEDAIGFVYCITNLTNGRRYIGKKNFFFLRRKKVANKRHRKIKFESDWREYWSSSETLKKDIMSLGEINFRREIIWLCQNKAQMNYLELREQLDRRVLETDDYYNEQIYCRIRKCKYLCPTQQRIGQGKDAVNWGPRKDAPITSEENEPKYNHNIKV